jgi:hypothetical protein
MKDIRRFFITLVMAFFFVTAIFIAESPAPVRDRPDEEPPFGLKTQGAAKGANHIGAISGEYYNFVETYDVVDTNCSEEPSARKADVRTLVRLRKGNQTSLQTFYGEKTDVDVGIDLADMQDDIIDLMKCQVLEAFFDISPDDCESSGLDVILKDADQFGELNTDTALTGEQRICDPADGEPDYPECTVRCGGSSFFLWDVVVVVN